MAGHAAQLVRGLWPGRIAGIGRTRRFLADPDHAPRAAPGLGAASAGVAAASGLANVTVRTVDAGNSTAYAGAVPADLVIMIGILGNISETMSAYDHDCASALPTCPTLLWSRATSPDDANSLVRKLFSSSRFRRALLP